MTEHNTTSPTYTADEIMAFMMDALDGVLSEQDERILTAQLIHYPELAQEWQAMQAIDELFTTAPMAAPPARFAAQTMARLPNLTMRRTVSAAVFTLFFIGGLLPFLFVVGLGVLLLGDGTAVSTLFNIVGNFGQFSAVLLGAIGQLIVGMGNSLGQYPAVMGTIMVMIGSIFLWSGVYRQLVTSPQVA